MSATNFVDEALRMDAGRSLNQMYLKATDAINRLKAIKAALLEMRATVIANVDGIYELNDETKITEIINSLAQDLNDI